MPGCSVVKIRHLCQMYQYPRSQINAGSLPILLEVENLLTSRLAYMSIVMTGELRMMSTTPAHATVLPMAPPRPHAPPLPPVPALSAHEVPAGALDRVPTIMKDTFHRVNRSLAFEISAQRVVEGGRGILPGPQPLLRFQPTILKCTNPCS